VAVCARGTYAGPVRVVNTRAPLSGNVLAHGVTRSRAEGLAVSHADEGVEPGPREDADKEQQETTDRYTEQPSRLGLAPQCRPASPRPRLVSFALR